MEECQSADTNGLAPGLRHLGWGQRGWHVFLVGGRPSGDANGESHRIFRVVMAEKVLELVQQEVEMIVYVNPKPSGADEWVIRGEVWKIGSPQMEGSFEPTTAGGHLASVPKASSSRRARRG